jgi:hypothetical protein
MCYPEDLSGDPTGFLGGYCVIFECTDTSCPSGAGCFSTTDSTVCLDDCTADSECRAGYACADGACMPDCTSTGCPDGYVCNPQGICEEEPCVVGAAPTDPGGCPAGTLCQGGDCVLDIGEGPGDGPGPVCDNLPSMTCDGTAAYCAELIAFDPRVGDGYDDYALNGETSTNQYRSFLRRDVVTILKYAAAKTACKTADWEFGNGGPVGLGDMSEADGAIPGTSINDPGHPEGTHVSGFDIDMGYFQVGTSDNRLRPICEHTTGGQEQYHCTAPPHLLDPWRQAYYYTTIYESGRIRVIGVDGKAGLGIQSAMTQLCSAGWATGGACSGRFMAYEVTDGGAGWYYFHHHHTHASFTRPGSGLAVAGPACLVPGCDVSPLEDYLDQFDLELRRVPRLPTGLDFSRR